MTWCATQMRSTPCWWCCSPHSRRSLPIPRGLRPWRFSNAIQAPRPSRRPRWRVSAHSCMRLSPRHDGRPTAPELVGLAKASISSGVAVAARSSSLRILCDQLDHTQKNLEQLQREIDQLLDQDPKATGMLGVPEFGPTTVGVLRAELGDLARFTRIDQVVAYVGLDLQVTQSGKWKGQTKLSKQGSGRVRRILYLAALRSIHLKTSPFGAYYQRLVARGMKKGMAVVVVMRKMLMVAVHLIQTEERYDPGKVAMQAGS